MYHTAARGSTNIFTWRMHMPNHNLNNRNISLTVILYSLCTSTRIFQEDFCDDNSKLIFFFVFFFFFFRARFRVVWLGVVLLGVCYTRCCAARCCAILGVVRLGVVRLGVVLLGVVLYSVLCGSVLCDSVLCYSVLRLVLMTSFPNPQLCHLLNVDVLLPNPPSYEVE